jgi:hypothetical protein
MRRLEREFGARWEWIPHYGILVDRLTDAGEGARAIAYLARSDGSGHVLNVVHDRNGIVLLDGQLGRFGDVEHELTELRLLLYREGEP